MSHSSYHGSSLISSPGEMTATKRREMLASNWRRSHQQTGGSTTDPAPSSGGLAKFLAGSVFSAAQPDAVFESDLSQGLADTSWEQQESSGWISDDEEDQTHIETTLQKARLFSSLKIPSAPNHCSNSITENELKNSNISPSASSAGTAKSYPLGELADFLLKAGLENWVEKFLEQDIELKCIADLSDADLIGLGMDKIGTRKKFYRAVREWVQQFSSS